MDEIQILREQNELLRGMVSKLAEFIVGLMNALPDDLKDSQGARDCERMATTILAEFFQTKGGPQ